MADDTTMTPVGGAEPPKANPLAKPASSNSSTLTLKPLAKPAGTAAGLKLPPKPGLPTAGLKLPPKPGLPTAGLKLPPKPGAQTQSGLKLPPKSGLSTAGLKLPPKPGMPTQSGLKLPPKPGLATAGLNLPTRPVIHKPGTGSTQSLLRPTLSGLKKPTLAGVTKPTASAASVAPTLVKPAAPAPAPAPAPAAPVADLAPVTPTEVQTAAIKPNQTAALDALKDATQNLKSVTAPIPQQAILRKTGMLAEEKSEAQKQAAKSKTSRISLSEAMGAAPVQNENAPMKTIRIKRPIDIPGMTKPAEVATTATEAKTVPATATTATEAKTVPIAASSEPSVSLTQRKTLKISRPSSGAMRPSGKFGIKRPGTMATAKPGTPKPDAAQADGKAPAAGGDVPEIADIPPIPTAAAPKPAATGEKDLPKGVSILGILIQAAACVTMGALAWWLYTDTQILPF